MVVLSLDFIIGMDIGDIGVRRGLFNECIKVKLSRDVCENYVENLKRG